MGFRNIIIHERCKLEYSLNYLICRRGTEEKRVLLDEIKLIVILSTQVSITTSLVCMLSQSKIKLIFCNEQYNPECELTPYENNYYAYRKIKEQIRFVQENKGYLWKKIVQKKIENQAKNLLYKNYKEEYNLLIKYQGEVKDADQTNREGHSAKVYFNTLFGIDFSRNKDILINKYLNYGYSIVLSAINREIRALGYLTELGIHHIGESNPFNLSCDLIEPIRPLIDSYIIKGYINEENFKFRFIEMLSSYVQYNGKKIFLDNAIHLYVIDLINYMKEHNELDLKFIEYEL